MQKSTKRTCSSSRAQHSSTIRSNPARPCPARRHDHCRGADRKHASRSNFRRGVTVLGGDTVTDPDTLLDTIAEGGSGYHFFGKSAEKTIISRAPAER